jgi:hypothetical protein
VRLPGTLKELSRQLAAFPCVVRRVEFPTEHGMLVLEFGDAKAEQPEAAAPRARRAPEEPAKPPAPDGRLPDKPKIRDTRLLARTPPQFFGEEVA